MRNLTDYISDKNKNTEIITVESKVQWTHKFKQIFNEWKKCPDDFTEKMKQDIYSCIENFYKDYPTKRKAAFTCGYEVIINLRDPQGWSLKLYNIYKKCGLADWIRMAAIETANCGYNVCHGRIEGISNSKTVPYEKIQWRDDHFQDTHSEKEYGNGYVSSIKSEDVIEYREKFLKCIKNANVKILKFTRNASDKITYQIIYTPVFDDSAVKRLITDIENDEKLSDIANSVNSVGRAISDYYAKKRSGGYTGD